MILSVACGPGLSGPDAGAGDAGTVTDAGAPDGGSSADAGAVDAGFGDAGASDAGGGADAGCVGPCADTLLTITLRGQQGTFDRALHGFELDGGFYVEAYFGGEPGCEPLSRPPERTLSVWGLRVGDGGVQTSADGLRVAMVDTTGTLSPQFLERAVDVEAMPRFVEPGRLVSFTLSATFDGGALTGGFAAPHCTELDRR
jgi:hypothetical protein